MKRFRFSDPISASVMALAILVLLGSLVVALLPKPSINGQRNGEVQTRAKLMKQVSKRNADLATMRAQLAVHTWALPVDQATGKALARMTALAAKHRLKLTGFRPQKAMPVETLQVLPFFVSVEGAFLDVTALVREIEATEPKFVVTLLQFSSADASTDRITASINLASFIPVTTTTAPPTPAPAKPATATKTSTTTKTVQHISITTSKANQGATHGGQKAK